MTKKIEIVEIVDEGNFDYLVEYNKCGSVEEFIESKKLTDEDGFSFSEEDWFCVEKNGWMVYGYTNSEYWGMCKVVEEGDKKMFKNMDGDDLVEFVDRFELSDLDV